MRGYMPVHFNDQKNIKLALGGCCQVMGLAVRLMGGGGTSGC